MEVLLILKISTGRGFMIFVLFLINSGSWMFLCALYFSLIYESSPPYIEFTYLPFVIRLTHFGSALSFFQDQK